MNISFSKARTWRRCHKQYDYRYNQQLEKRKLPVPMFRGRILGECLDAVVAGESWAAVLAKYEKEYKRLFDEEKEEYGDLIGDIRSIVARYLSTYATEKYSYLMNPETHKPSEHRVEVDMGDGVTFVGYIDKIALDEAGRKWIMDHKSHKNLPDEDARFSDLQLAFYVAMAPKAGYGEMAGIIWDYVRTKPPAIPELLKNGSLTKRQNIDTTYEVYLDTIKAHGLNPADYADMLAMLKEKPNDFFRRVRMANPNKTMIENITKDLKHTAIEIRELGDVAHQRSMSRDCKQCTYYLLCQTELRGMDAEFIRKTEYTVKEKSDGDRKENGESAE
jgi:hypothetical protein